MDVQQNFAKNFATDPPVKKGPPRPRGPRFHRAVKIGWWVSLVPTLLGILTMLSWLFTPDTPPPHDEPLVGAIAWYLWLAILPVFVTLSVLRAEARRTHPELRAKVAEVAALRASRGRLVDASDAARREIERDLHDGVQPRVVALLLNVGMARRAGQFDGAPAVIGNIEHELREILREIRAVASGILPPALTDLGLDAAVTELTARMPFRVEFSGPAGRLPARAEVTAYFVIAEALTNAAKHAEPTRVTVRVDVRGNRASVEIHDDGRGGANASGGTGLLGLADRVDTLDGRLTVASPRGGGTTVTAEFSCAS
jgi:signal transduction histidine kinase